MVGLCILVWAQVARSLIETGINNVFSTEKGLYKLTVIIKLIDNNITIIGLNLHWNED